MIGGFLRRKATVSSGGGAVRIYYEYLFLPIQHIDFKFNGQKIAPTIPGQNASTVTGIVEATGAKSNNFMLDLGMQRMQLNAAVTLQPLDDFQVPTLNGNTLSTDTHADVPPFADTSACARYFNFATLASVTSVGDTGVPLKTPEDLRDAIISFTADQSFIDSQQTVEYSEFAFGYPNWNRSDGSLRTPPYTDPTLACVAGTDYRIWYGMVDTISGAEDAGAPSNFDVSIAFNVGAPLL